MAENIYILSKKDLDQFKKEVLDSVEALKEEAMHSRLNYMRSSEVMKELGISSSHLQKMRIKGIIPYSKIGDTFFYPREEIIAMLQKNGRGINPINNNFSGFTCSVSKQKTYK